MARRGSSVSGSISSTSANRKPELPTSIVPSHGRSMVKSRTECSFVAVAPGADTSLRASLTDSPRHILTFAAFWLARMGAASSMPPQSSRPKSTSTALLFPFRVESTQTSGDDTANWPSKCCNRASAFLTDAPSSGDMATVRTGVIYRRVNSSVTLSVWSVCGVMACRVSVDARAMAMGNNMFFTNVMSDMMNDVLQRYAKESKRT